MQKILKFILFTLLSLFLTQPAYGVRINDTPNYYSSVETIPPDYRESCSIPCGQPVAETCWNGSTPGVKVDCGDACVRGGGENQRSWTRYVYTQSTCRKDPDLSLIFGEEVCMPIYTISGDTCSTADKYNISSYGGGDTTMLRAGACTCQARNLYKTCCNGANAVGTYQAGGNPSFPDGGCSFTTTPCGSDPSIYNELGFEYKNVSCGQAACQAYFGGPTPTPTKHYKCSAGACVEDASGAFSESTCGNSCNTSCPGYAPPATTTSGSCPANTTCSVNQPSQTVQSSCTPGQTCSVPCSFTCRDSLGRTCPATSCSTVWACQGGVQWYNDGRYYYSCPSSCSVCTPGQTQTVCGTQQSQCRVP